MQYLHRLDEDKVGRLAASMREVGWQGGPIVTTEEQLITGNHRYAAAQKAGIYYESIDVRDVTREADMDYDAMMAEEVDVYESTWYEALVHVLGQLPEAIQAKYGIDVGG